MGKFCGSTEKVEYRCTTTNILLCNDITIVLKIAPLHSVSVITNFVIPKYDKQTKQTPLFSKFIPKITNVGDFGGCKPTF